MALTSKINGTATSVYILCYWREHSYCLNYNLETIKAVIKKSERWFQITCNSSNDSLTKILNHADNQCKGSNQKWKQ